MPLKVYIDQGHNPVNPNAGAEGNGLREQDIVYTVGKKLESLLKSNADFEVKLSRPSENTQLGTSTATSLAARVNQANEWGADYFISLHTNSSQIKSAGGSEAFVYSKSLKSYGLAERILFWLNKKTGLANRGVFARPGLYVLRKTKMPATLVELGFITNQYEAKLMLEKPELFAEGIYYGIEDYSGLL